MADQGTKSNGTSKAGATKALAARAVAPSIDPLAAPEWGRVAQAFAGLPLSSEQLRQFAAIEGSDHEPWDT
ncbi:MAG: hypothetical protein JNL50_12835, partial [Phycisphaerae bacterium]|nr:hypothetical protein [Phycisphaerae bacterium]